MSTRLLPASEHAAVQNELLAQLGLPPTASPEDVDALHEAASEYLAAAPSNLRGWAHAQASVLDSAYLQLTDPVGLEGSALRSPTRPPTVVPGGPATPPARRDSVPAHPTSADAEAIEDDDEIIDEDLVGDELGDEELEDEDPGTDFDSLYASVTPSAHEDMGPEAKPRRRARAASARHAAAQQGTRARHRANIAPEPASGGIWKKITLGGAAVIAVFAIGFAANAIVNSSAIAPLPTAASPSAPTVDQALVSQLMTKYAASPNDTTTLLDLANAFYAGEDYTSAGQWLDKLLAIDPNNVQALLARGAVSFNLGDLSAAETSWKKVEGLAPDNVEVHYDLGFLYLNQTTPDWAGVQREWSLVIQLDPGSDLATTVQSHLDALVASSMIPASPSPGSSPTVSAGPSGSAPAPTPSAAASAAGSPGASQATASPAPAETIAPASPVGP